MNSGHGADGSAPGWVRKGAQADLDGRSLTSRVAAQAREAIESESPSWQSMALATSVAACFLVWSLAAQHTKPTFLEAWAPDDAAGALGSLWQVHAAIVGLSIPLLVLLAEQTKSNGVLATTATQVMVSESWILTTTALALLSVAEIGISSLYLASDGALLASTVFSMVVVLMILRAYWRALALMISPTLLRRRSELVLLRRLDRSVRDDFVIALANDRLAQTISAWSPTRISDDAIRRGEWTPVNSPTDGRISDIRADVLQQVLLRNVTPIAVGQATTDSDGDAKTGIDWPFGDVQGRVLLTPVGDVVHQGKPLFALPGTHDENVRREVLSAIAIESLD